MDITHNSPLNQTSVKAHQPIRRSTAMNMDMDMTFLEEGATFQVAAEIAQEIKQLQQSIGLTSVLMFDDDEQDDFHKSLDRITFDNTSLDSNSKEDVSAHTMLSDQMEITHMPKHNETLATAKQSATAYEDGLDLTNIPPTNGITNTNPRTSLASRTTYEDQLKFTYVQSPAQVAVRQRQPNHTIRMDQSIVDDSYDANQNPSIPLPTIRLQRADDQEHMNFTRMPDVCNEDNASIEINETFHMRPGLCSTKIDISTDDQFT